MGLEERSIERRRRMKVHRARDYEDAEQWGLEFWQSQTPAARLAALVAIHRDVESVRGSEQAS